MSLKCGALGLNLTCCQHVVMVDPWWNPAVGAYSMSAEIKEIRINIGIFAAYYSWRICCNHGTQNMFILVLSRRLFHFIYLLLFYDIFLFL